MRGAPDMAGDLVGAIEAGGTKFVCAVGTAGGGPLEAVTLPTRDPDSTFEEVGAFFRAMSRRGRLRALGIGSFGPLDLEPGSATYGQILRTPKPGWAGVNLIARARSIGNMPVALDTDVNAAALAEIAAAGSEVRNLAYVTVGTGIGVGLVIDGKPVHGLGHPEVGHMLVRRHPAHDGFDGICRFHGDCLEGLASGPAIEAAAGMPASSVPAGHPLWIAQAWYLAQLCSNLLLTVAPHRIVLGGGVMHQDHLFDAVRRMTIDLLGGYLTSVSEANIHEVIGPPRCGAPSGLVGALLLGGRVASERG